MLHPSNYLQSIYIVLNIVSNLEVIWTIQEIVCKHYTILYKRLEDPQVLFSAQGLKTNSWWVPGDNCILKLSQF